MEKKKSLFKQGKMKCDGIILLNKLHECPYVSKVDTSSDSLLKQQC
jgi:hypothetical protein